MDYGATEKYGVDYLCLVPQLPDLKNGTYVSGLLLRWSEVMQIIEHYTY